MTEDKDEDEEAEIIPASTTLQDKVGDVTLTVEDLQAIERAQGVIAKLTAKYVEVANNDLENLQAVAAGLLAEPGNHARHLAHLFQISHDMKGQGGSFGYPLITTVGNQLCRFVERLGDDIGDDAMEVIMLHVDALQVILRDDMKDPDTEEAKTLLDGLERVIAKVAG